MKSLSVLEVEYAAHAFVQEFMKYDEPLPEFETRFPGKLESCLSQPFKEFGGSPLYPSIEEKAAILFYLIIKNHPFLNGNKRMAVATLLVWLFKNDKWINIEPDGLYELALIVANSRTTEKDTVLKRLHEIFTKVIQNLK